MKPSWYNSRAVSSVPLVLFFLLFISYSASLAFFTSCGSGIAGCKGLRDGRVANIARLDKRPVVRQAFMPVAGHGVARLDKGEEAKRKKDEAVRQSALKVVVTRYERRLVWTFFSGLSVLLSVVSLAAAVLVARAAPSTRRLDARRRILLVLLPAFALLGLLSWFAEAQMPTMHPMLQATVGREHSLGMPRIALVMGVMNALSNACGIALALAVWLLLRPGHSPDEPPPGTGEELEKRLASLRETSVWLRVFLYAGTAGLVAGVLRMNATISWMQSFLIAADEPTLDTLRTTLVGTIGTFYSLMLASLYLPAVFIVRERARGVIHAAAVPAKVKTAALGETNFSTSLKDVLPKIVALLGPVLAGPVGEFLKNLSG
jgi:hypothetical protein